MSKLSLKFNKCLVIANPASSNHKRAQHLTRQLQQHIPDTRTVEIVPGDEKKTNKLILDALKSLDSKSLVAVGGGDGSVSRTVNTLLTDSKLPKTARSAAILPLWGGNANDLAYMLNGTSWKIDIQRILARGRRVAIYPIEISLSGPKISQTLLATNYISFGASAYAARHVNEIDYQKHRLYQWPITKPLMELGSVLRSVKSAKSFTAEINGKKVRLYDLIMVNGSRIAKVYRAPNRLTDRFFFELAIKHNRPRLWAYFTRIMRGLTLKRNRRTERSLKVHDATWAQIDGEVIEVPKHTDIAVILHEKPFYALSTRLTRR
jgi:diacylglycerol kinase family enzyme